jgi:hypothetical protein
MTAPAPSRERESLSRTDCLALLAPGGHGRVAATSRAIPVIIPVTFTLVDEDVVFVGEDGVDGQDGFPRAVANSVVAFETDPVGADEFRWYVHVTGVATPCREAARPGFRLSTEIVSGWRARG